MFKYIKAQNTDIQETKMKVGKIKTLDIIGRQLSSLSLSGQFHRGYHFKNVIAEGGCAIVYVVTKSKVPRDNIHELKSLDTETANLKTRMCIAAAKVSKRRVYQHCEQERKSWISEVEILSSFKHQNIVQCLEFFHLKEHAVLVTEFVDGCDLFDLISKSYSVPINSRSLICQVFEALDFLHNIHDIAHMDMKAENVLVDKKGGIKLCDFGSAVRIPTCGKIRTFGITTPLILPPEYFTHTTCDARACDMWGVGVIMYMLLLQRYPYGNGDYLHIPIVEYRQELDFSGINEELFEDMIALIRSCLNTNPKRRITVKTALQANFFKLK